MNFINIAWRRLCREKFYALVCICSLALGIAGSLLISLYLVSELTFDHYHKNYARIYRVTSDFSGTKVATSGFEIGPLVVEDYPPFLNFVRFKKAPENEFDYGDKSNQWGDVFLADPSIFEVFTIIPLRGDPATALQDPYSIAISETLANYYFGDRDPIGELLTTDRFEFRITLVFEDLPDNVTQQYDAILPFQLSEIYQPDITENFAERFISNHKTYFLVTRDFDPSSFKPISESLFQDYIRSGFGEVTGNVENLVLTHDLQNLGDMRFGQQYVGGEVVGSLMNVYIFSAIVVALLLSSCINYVNLATARAATRAREVSVKKLLGADKGHLILQFIGESVFHVGIAFILGILLAQLVIELGVVERFTGKTELGQLLLSPESISLLTLAWLMIGVLAGIYPAFQLSKPSLMLIVRPLGILHKTTIHLREVLVLLQLTVAIAIISSVLIMLRQSDFLLNTPLGFEKSSRYVVQLQGGG